MVGEALGGCGARGMACGMRGLSRKEFLLNEARYSVRFADDESDLGRFWSEMGFDLDVWRGM